jgi:hypothetical protein
MPMFAKIVNIRLASGVEAVCRAALRPLFLFPGHDKGISKYSFFIKIIKGDFSQSPLL